MQYKHISSRGTIIYHLIPAKEQLMIGESGGSRFFFYWCGKVVAWGFRRWGKVHYLRKL